VGRATVYRQFKDKHELQALIAWYCLDRFDAANILVEKHAKDPLDAIRLVIQNIIPLYSELTFLNKFERPLKSNDELQLKMQQQDNEIRDLIDLAVNQGLICDKYTVDWVFYFFEGLLWAAYKTSQLGSHSSAKAADLAFSSFKNGVT
jgi:AcrR family transcriptional regulator